MGGTKGKTLSTSVQQIYADFEGAINSFRSVGYDIMDLEVKRFDDDFYEFRVTSKELGPQVGQAGSDPSDGCITDADCPGSECIDAAWRENDLRDIYDNPARDYSAAKAMQGEPTWRKQSTSYHATHWRLFLSRQNIRF